MLIRVFKHYIPLAYAVLIVLEAGVLFSSLFLAETLINYLRVSTVPTGAGLDWIKALFFTVTMTGSLSTMGIYRRLVRIHKRIDLLLRIFLGLSLGVLILSIFFYFYPALFIGRAVIAVTVAISFVGIVVLRVIFIRLSDNEILKRRILVIGAGKAASQLEELRRRGDRYGFDLIGYVHVFGEHNIVDDKKIIVPNKPLVELVKEYEIDEIVVAVNDRRKSFPVDEILECKMEGIDVIDLIAFFERQTGKIKLDALHPSSLIFSDGFDKIIQANVSKRIFDLIASLTILVISSPILLLAIASILVESGIKGKVFYLQERVGLDGKIFKVIKLRTMREDAEADGKARWSGPDDNRLTKNGRILRHFRIDEIPQLINVLRGDMTLVGPRPERPQFVEQLAQIIPFYNMRHRVKPGVTGWAQISYPYGSSEHDAIQKLQYDLFYMKNYSILFDLIILLQTAATVIFGDTSRRKAPK